MTQTKDVKQQGLLQRLDPDRRGKYERILERIQAVLRGRSGLSNEDVVEFIRYIIDQEGNVDLEELEIDE